MSNWAKAKVILASDQKLASMLKNKKSAVRIAAVKALKNRRTYSAHTINGLAEAQNDENQEVRVHASEAISNIRRKAKSVVPHLIKSLKNKDSEVRRLAAKALLALGRNASLAIPALVDALNDNNESVQIAAAFALPKIGYEAHSAIPALMRILKVCDHSIKRAVLRSIVKLIPEAFRHKKYTLGDMDSKNWAISIAEDLWEGSENDEPEVSDAIRYLTRLISPGAASDGAHSLSVTAAEIVELANAKTLPGEVKDIKPDITVCYTKEISYDKWYSLLAYMHLPELLEVVKRDSHKSLDETEIGRLTTASTANVVARGSKIVIIPELAGCEFNPPCHHFKWLEDFHRIEFRFRTNAGSVAVDHSLNGRIAYFCESVLIGEVPISVYISGNSSNLKSEMLEASKSAKLYNSVFVSYSHHDTVVVNKISSALQTLGMDMLRDTDILRAGENWKARLAELISNADIFQLYWSENAKNSTWVEEEWRYALSTNRTNFIRPLYWGNPMPDPPEDLRHIHFAYYEMI